MDLVAWPLQREDSHEEFQNKDLRKKRRFLHCYVLVARKASRQASLLFLLDRFTTSETLSSCQTAHDSR